MSTVQGFVRRAPAAMLLAALLLCCASAFAGQRNFTIQAKHAESIPLRDMPTIYEAPGAPHVEHEPLPLPPIKGAISLRGMFRPDPVAQTTPIRTSATPTVGLNFLGEGQNDSAVGGDPSDSEGAVGATQYVEWINTSYAVYNKSTGALVAGPTAGSSIFSALGGDCANTNDGDPIAKWDAAAQRWVLAQFSVSNGATNGYQECVAVSATSDATGAYHLYDFNYGTTNFDDYPKMGVWSDKYLITFNMFANGSTFAGGEICAYDRTNMLAGNAASQACDSPDANHGGILPSDIDGSTAPPSGEQGFAIALDTATTLAFWPISSVNYTTGALTLGSQSSITVPSYTEACNGGTCIPQNGTQQLDSLADRMMYRFSYRNFGTYESLLASHSVDPSGTGTGVSGIRWYEIRTPGTTPTLFQSGTYAPDSTYRWMPSIAQDHNGNIAVGFSLASSSLDPSIAVATRAPSDAAGTLGSETRIVTGGGASSGDSRWGDYSAMTVDPTDDCTMWYIAQYMQISGQFSWDTRIANFKMPNCGVATNTPANISSPTPSSTLPGDMVKFTWNAATGAQYYQLWVGTCKGCLNIFHLSSATGGTSATATGLPTNGATLYVRLLTHFSSGWLYNDYTYTASSGQANITSPTPGSMLSGTSATFSWNAVTGGQYYQLWVGSCAGCLNIYHLPTATSGTSATATGLPANGSTIYVRLLTHFASGWEYTDTTYVSGP